jgi:hypothetical protein
MSCTLLIAACEPARKPADPAALTVASASDSADVVEKILASKLPLPSRLLEGHYTEFRRGAASTGFDIGPVDYVSYVAAAVPPESIDAWIARFKPLGSKPAFTAPACDCPWWVAIDQHDQLEFFEAGALSHRLRGWIGVSRRDAKIYLFDWTT